MHESISVTLESRERQNRKLLKTEYVEPKVGMGATLIGFWDQIPCTVILVEARRMLVQEDEVVSTADGYEFRRNTRGVIRGFKRVLNSKRWRYAADKNVRDGQTLNIVAGERRCVRLEMD